MLPMMGNRICNQSHTNLSVKDVYGELQGEKLALFSTECHASLMTVRCLMCLLSLLISF